jgi:hypothetical protein
MDKYNWLTSPRTYGLSPEAIALDHSAKVSRIAFHFDDRPPNRPFSWRSQICVRQRRGQLGENWRRPVCGNLSASNNTNDNDMVINIAPPLQSTVGSDHNPRDT